MRYTDFTSLYPDSMYRKALNIDNLPEIFSTKEFNKTCSELKLEKQKISSLYDLMLKNYKIFPESDIDFDAFEKEYRYILNLDLNEISDEISIENISNKCIRISNIDYIIDAETNTLHIQTKDIIHLFSLEELKNKVTEYRKSYKIIKNTLKLLKMEKDF